MLSNLSFYNLLFSIMLVSNTRTKRVCNMLKYYPRGMTWDSEENAIESEENLYCHGYINTLCSWPFAADNTLVCETLTLKHINVPRKYFFLYFLVSLKRMPQNYWKILRKCFLVTVECRSWSHDHVSSLLRNEGFHKVRSLTFFMNY